MRRKVLTHGLGPSTSGEIQVHSWDYTDFRGEDVKMRDAGYDMEMMNAY
jgi:hypothetical protein